MKLALLGRDGVINKTVEGGVNHRTKLELIADSIDAIAELSVSGYRVVVLTHQPGISRGMFDLDELEAINSNMTIAVEKAGGEIAAIFYCPHDEQDRCHCRPPKSGLLDVVEMEFDCDTSGAAFFCASDAEKELARAKNCVIYDCSNDCPLSAQVKRLLESCS